jgi:hypothetical protein
VGGRVHVLITTENGQIDRERPMDGDHWITGSDSRSAVSMGDFMESNHWHRRDVLVLHPLRISKLARAREVVDRHLHVVHRFRQDV